MEYVSHLARWAADRNLDGTLAAASLISYAVCLTAAATCHYAVSGGALAGNILLGLAAYEANHAHDTARNTQL